MVLSVQGRNIIIFTEKNLNNLPFLHLEITENANIFCTFSQTNSAYKGLTWLWFQVTCALRQVTMKPWAKDPLSTAHHQSTYILYSTAHVEVMSPLRPLLGPQSWCPTFKSSHSNSFEDRAPVDEIYGCPIFEWVAQVWSQGKGARIMVPAMDEGRHTPFIILFAFCCGLLTTRFAHTLQPSSLPSVRVFQWSSPKE